MTPTAHAHRLALRAGLPHLFGLLALSVAGLAQAASFSGPVTVSLMAPGGITSDGVTIDTTPLALTQSVPPDSAILPGVGEVGGFMLPLESIRFDGTSILVRVSQGASNGTTGYLGLGGQHARYEFSNLNVAGQVISGMSYSLADNFGVGPGTGLNNGAALISSGVVKLTSPHSVVLELDQLQFRDRGLGESNNFADFRIDLQVTAVPEPATGAMALLGLVMLGAATRRARPHA